MRFELITKAQGPVLQAYSDSTDRRCFIMGPLGSGKTFESCVKIFKKMCLQKPNHEGIRKTRFYAIRNTYPDLLTTTIKDWLELFGDLGKYKGGGVSPPSHTLKFQYTDEKSGLVTIVQSEIVFIAMDKPLAVKKLRGAQLTGAWLNEAKELHKSTVDMVDLRVGRYPSKADGGPTWWGIFGDTNAPDDDSWYYKLAEEVKPNGWVFLRQPGGVVRRMVEDELGRQSWSGEWEVNPEAENIDNLIPDYYKDGMEGKDADWIAVNLANEYGDTNDGKPVYEKQWNDTIHTSSTIQVIPGQPIIIGLDFGLTPAAVIGQETPGGCLNILHEVIGDGQGIKQFVGEALRPLLNREYRDCPWNLVGDPSGHKRADTDESTVFKVLEEMGLAAEAANTNDPDIRWESVRVFLQQLRDGKPAFKLHKRCKVLRKGFNSGYHFKLVHVSGAPCYSSKVNKNKFSHPHDALQYLCMWINGNSVPTVGFTRSSNNDDYL